MKIRPLHDRVLIRRLDVEEKTKGGIIIPDAAQEKPQEGEVVAVGNGKLLDDGSIQPLNVKVKDKVLFGKYGGAEIALGGEDMLILKEDEILAIINKK
ncbi:MAG: co-chaperone GroES [Thermodesulfobacteriota bacterium]